MGTRTKLRRQQRALKRAAEQIKGVGENVPSSVEMLVEAPIPRIGSGAEAFKELGKLAKVAFEELEESDQLAPFSKKILQDNVGEFITEVQDDTTKRHAQDMNTGGWLSKNYRPIIAMMAVGNWMAMTWAPVFLNFIFSTGAVTDSKYVAWTVIAWLFGDRTARHLAGIWKAKG